MKGYKKILIAVNGSKDILVQGLKVARDEKCWVTVLKVIPAYDGDLNLVGIKNIKDVLDGEGEKSIDEIKGVAEAEKTLAKARIEVGDIHKKIIKVAEEEKCDLIIIGASRGNGIKRLLGLNVTDKVIDNAPCPVMVVKS